MRSPILIPVVLLLGLLACGCMDKLHDYERCVDIETARCELRDRCVSGFDFDTCVAYYEEFCRTRRLKNARGIDKDDVQACVTAISGLPCEALYDADGVLGAVDETANLPECDFIDEPDDDADGGADSDVDADSDSDADDAGV